jgi:hypothetical protein
MTSSPVYPAKKRKRAEGGGCGTSLNSSIAESKGLMKAEGSTKAVRCRLEIEGLSWYCDRIAISYATSSIV